MIKVVRCKKSHEPTIQTTVIDTYIHIFRRGKDHTTLPLSVPPEYQELILMLGKALCVHMPSAATITNRDFLVRANSRIKGAIGLSVTVTKDHMENMYVRVC